MTNEKTVFPSFALYTANCTGNEQNTLYPNRCVISDQSSLALACTKDHCAAKLKNNYRNLENFIECGVLMLDIDNDGNEKNDPSPEQWRTSQQVSDILPGVAFYAVASRNNGKVKHSGEGKKERSARPRYHLYFPLRCAIKDSELIKRIKISVHGLIPEIDDNAVDSVRFFYGHSKPEVKYFSGDMDICEFFAKHPELVKKATTAKQQPERTKRPTPATGDFDQEFIKENAWTILECIPAYGEKTWSEVAYILKREGLPFELFDRWSATAADSYSSKYKGKSGQDACIKKWNEKRTSSGNNLGFGYLYKLALENDPTLRERITKTGQYKQRKQKATTAPVVDPETGEIKTVSENSEIINGITVKQAVEQPKPTPAAQTEEIPPLETFDADYFNNTDIPEPTPIINRILFPGLGMLGSPAKMGKSYMMLQLAVSVATGESFLGFDVVRPGSVLYLDLQGTKARTKKRLASMGYETMPKGITLAYRARNTDNGFLEQIEQWISTAENPSLVIIDMMEQIKGSQRRTEDAYRSDNRILEPLHDIALRHDISIFGVMHTRKGYAKIKPDDPFNEIIGSVAQFGTADCAWMILGKRDEDKKQLSVICRDNDDGQEDFEAIFKNHRWTVSGTVEEIEEKKAVTEYNNNPVVFTIRTLIKESGGGWYGTMTDLIQEVATRTNEYPAATPEKMKATINTLAYRLSCEGIEIDYPNKNGGSKGRRYHFYRKTPEQMKEDI